MEYCMQAAYIYNITIYFKLPSVPTRLFLVGLYPA